MDAAVPWRRHRKPPELPELAENDRSSRNRLKPTGMAHGSGRIGAISTSFAIRAYLLNLPKLKTFAIAASLNHFKQLRFLKDMTETPFKTSLIFHIL